MGRDEPAATGGAGPMGRGGGPPVGHEEEGQSALAGDQAGRWTPLWEGRLAPPGPRGGGRGGWAGGGAAGGGEAGGAGGAVRRWSRRWSPARAGSGSVGWAKVRTSSRWVP